jgi:hypothetical protein
MKYTKIFLLILAVVIFGYDVFIINSQGKSASISWVIIKYSYEYPSLTYLAGFVSGHLLWRMKKPEGKK